MAYRIRSKLNATGQRQYPTWMISYGHRFQLSRTAPDHNTTHSDIDGELGFDNELRPRRQPGPPGRNPTQHEVDGRPTNASAMTSEAGYDMQHEIHTLQVIFIGFMSNPRINSYPESNSQQKTYQCWRGVQKNLETTANAFGCNTTHLITC